MDDAQLAEIARELDEVRARAKQAYRAKDVPAYMETFAPDLVYRKPNGREIGRPELTRDVKRQLMFMRSYDSSFTRESLNASGAEATEVLAQTAHVETLVFRVLRRVWNLRRRGRYTWRRSDGGWQIARVEVLEETVKAG